MGKEVVRDRRDESLMELLDIAEAAGFPEVVSLVRALRALHVSVDGDWWSVALIATDELRTSLADLEREVVVRARIDGVTWADIAGALDITRQGAHKRFGRTDVAELDALDERHEARLELIQRDTDLELARRFPGVARRKALALEAPEAQAIKRTFMERWFEEFETYREERAEVEYRILEEHE